MAQIIIGLSGSAGVGKDTMADYLCDRHRFAKLALADPMKEICRDVFQFTQQQLYGPSQCRNEPDARWDGLSPRKALQLLGTEWGRACHPDTWIRLTLAKAAVFRDSVVIPDIRFANEIRAIQAKGGVVVRLRRELERDPLTLGVAGHSSEREQLEISDDAYDFAVKVNPGLESFYQQIEANLPTFKAFAKQRKHSQGR